jgi:hypothetical protein
LTGCKLFGEIVAIAWHSQVTLREGLLQARYSVGLNPFKAIADSVGYPRFVSDLLGSVFNANLDVQTMNQTSTRLAAAGFVALGQVIGPFKAGDVALAGSRIGLYDGQAWVGIVQPGGLRPPYRIYRRR